ncbi:MAG: helix-turn-helix transcriptional regulator [Thermodesulfobacteriota bacterium]
MVEQIKTLQKIRKLIGWSTKELADKTRLSRNVILRLEAGKPLENENDFIWNIITALKREIRYRKKKNKMNYDQKNEQERVDLKEYFPNLSKGEIKHLFSKEWLQNNAKGYKGAKSKSPDDIRAAIIDLKNQSSEIQSDQLSRKICQKYGHIIYYLKYSKKEADDRLGIAISYAKGLMDSMSDTQRQKYFKGDFQPQYNPKACRWFEIFDKTNNTKGMYATNGGEFFIETLGYFLDYINHDLKLIMDWDEEFHYDINGSLYERDKIRQQNIEKYFPNYKFIRIREKEFEKYL